MGADFACGTLVEATAICVREAMQGEERNLPAPGPPSSTYSRWCGRRGNERAPASSVMRRRPLLKRPQFCTTQRGSVDAGYYRYFNGEKFWRPPAWANFGDLLS